MVEAAKTHDVSLIPFGGGTNVTDALRCDEREQRMIVSVDDDGDALMCRCPNAKVNACLRDLGPYSSTSTHSLSQCRTRACLSSQLIASAAPGSPTPS